MTDVVTVEKPAELVERTVLLEGFESPSRVLRLVGEHVELANGRVVPVQEARGGVLPMIGERVRWRRSGREFVWIGERAVSGQTQQGLASEHGLMWFSGEPSDMECTGELVPLEELGGLVRDMDRRFTQRLNSIVEEAHEWADDNDLCERFDDFMEEQGFPRRTHPHDIEVIVRLYRTVEAESMEHAQENVTVEQVRAWVEEEGPSYEFEVNEA